MNKNIFRVIWSVARAARVVVPEAATSAGKGTSKATSGGGVAAPTSTAPSPLVATAALFGLLVAMPGQAQIVANPMAPGGMRPIILVSPNGIPIANIATPSAAGVSRNQFLQFDVNARGVVVNNSRVNAQSGIGGWIVGNPNLATGPARVILSEVNSSNPSYINGPVEIAGQRAEFILANPSGIAVSGGTFINSSRVTLTTGTPQFNAFGGLDSYVVRGGTVSINGAGLDLSKTDYAAILARAVQVNAAINATDLKVVTGANTISADHTQITPTTGTGVVPTFALDVAQIGGMFANHIFLVGTEAGLGARNAGSIGASNGSSSPQRAGSRTPARWKARASSWPARATSTTGVARYARPAAWGSRWRHPFCPIRAAESSVLNPCPRRRLGLAVVRAQEALA
ncbi:two-partner secretion domain-containing protein [Variovorax gossypii]